MSHHKTWYVYMIRSDDNSLYTGITTDLNRRFLEHKNKSKKSAKYLRVRNVLSIDYVEEANSRSQASKREFEIKKLTKIKKEALIHSAKTA